MLKPSFSMVRSFIQLAALSLLTAGCGVLEVKKNSGNIDVRRQETAPKGAIRWLVPEDQACIDNGQSVSLSEITIYEWDGSRINQKRVPFKAGAGTEKEFLSANVESSIINFSAVYNCSYKNNVRDCTTDTSASPEIYTAMRICRANGLYKRDSLEGMTLTSQYYTERAYGFYNSIPTGKPGLIKSILVPQPKRKRHVTQTDGTIVDEYDADNASFITLPATEEFSEASLIMIDPTTTASFQKSPLNLWEVPFVMQHEFAHHVFNHYLGAAVQSLGLHLKARQSTSTIMPTSRTKHSPQFGLTTVDAPDNADYALKGINETFADLFAYFAGNSAKNQLKGVTCLDTSRDPSSSVTHAGSSKGLDKKRIDIYEGRATVVSNSDCREPQYDGEHDISAALGYPIAKFIEDSMPSSTGSARAAILLTWLTRLEPLIQKGRSSVTVDTIVRELVLAVKGQSQLKAAPCSEFRKQITGLPLASQACSP